MALIIVGLAFKKTKHTHHSNVQFVVVVLEKLASKVQNYITYTYSNNRVIILAAEYHNISVQ